MSVAEGIGHDLVADLRLQNRVATGDEDDVIAPLVGIDRRNGDRGRLDQIRPDLGTGPGVERAHSRIHRRADEDDRYSPTGTPTRGPVSLGTYRLYKTG